MKHGIPEAHKFSRTVFSWMILKQNRSSSTAPVCVCLRLKTWPKQRQRALLTYYLAIIGWDKWSTGKRSQANPTLVLFFGYRFYDRTWYHRDDEMVLRLCCWVESSFYSEHCTPQAPDTEWIQNAFTFCFYVICKQITEVKQLVIIISYKNYLNKFLFILLLNAESWIATPKP